MLRMALAGIAGFVLLSGDVRAQSDYPNKPVKILVPVAAGGGVDTIARIYAAHMSKVTGQQFYIENKPGAGNVIGIEYVARSPADGYTILMVAPTITLHPFIHKKLPYDPERDFIPVSQMVSIANVLVTHPSLPVNTLAEYIDLAKKKPGQINYASAGVGSSLHLSMELFKSVAQVDIVHVPYRGVGPAMQDLVAGHVNSMISNAFSARAHINSGKIRALGVTSRKRTDALPNIPTMIEGGLKDFEMLNWFGMFVAAGTPQPIVEFLHKEARAAMFSDDTKRRLSGEGADPVASSPAEFARFVKSEMVRWAAVAKSANIQLKD
jgi:tripartite-type tricarboxylate transporter receptor subunit TctC